MEGASPWGSLASILFTDIVRSTDLLYELGSERYEGVRRRHVAHLRTALQEHGGREVKSLGDGMMAIVPSAAGAIAVAVAMQRRTAAQARAAAIDLQLRVGVSAGDIAEVDADFHGPAVVEAARLCQVAAGGEILVSDVARRLAGDRPDFSFEEAGPRTLKGMPAPVHTHRVLWSPGRGLDVGSPAVLSGSGVFDLVGRATERAAVMEAWDRAAHGERRVVLIEGEPGIGKSRLAAEVAGEVHANGGQVLYGRCDPEGGGPLQPFVLALRQFLADVPGDSAPDLGRDAGALLAVLPELADRDPTLRPPEPSSDPAVERLALFDAVAEAFHRIAAGSPLLVVIEDVHWAGAQTVQLLRHVVGWPRDGALMLIATYRGAEASTELAALVAEASRLHRGHLLAMRAFDAAEVLDLLSSAARTDLRASDGARELAEELRDETGGNLLYLTQLLAHLVEAGLLRRVEGRWARVTPNGDLHLPESLRDLVLGRITAAGPDVVRLLELAAVAGTQFEPLLLEQLDDVDGRFLDALERAASYRIVEPIGSTLQYRFAHTVVRDVVYDRLSAVRRARLHDRLVEKLEAAGYAETAMLAHHAVQAAVFGPAQRHRAVRHARRAGDEAEAAFAFDVAAEWYATALEHQEATGVVEPDERAALLVRLGTAQRNAGIPAFRTTLLEASRIARDHGSVPLLVQATLANTRGTYADSHGLDAERIEMLRAALLVIPAEDRVDRARLLCSLAMELTSGPGFEDRQRLSDEALRLARESGERHTVAGVLARRQAALTHVATAAERATEVAELGELTEKLDDPVLRFWALHYAVKLAMQLGDAGRLQSDLATLESHAASLRQPDPLVYVARYRATVASIHADFETADRQTNHSLELGERVGAPDAAMIFASQRFSIRFVQGRLGDIAGAMRARKRESWPPAVWAHWSLLLAETGDPDEASESLRRQHEIDFWDYPQGHAAMSGIPVAALAAARVGDTALAARLLPVLDAATGFCFADSCYWYGPVAHHQGMISAVLGDLDRAVDHLVAAIALERDFGAQPWLARSLAEQARLRWRRGNSDDEHAAEQAATEALALATSLGLASIPELLGTALPV